MTRGNAAGWIAAAAMLWSAGCGGEPGEGTVTVAVDGEQGAREGWPFTADGETIGFVDGWTLTFDAVVASVDDFALRTGDGDDAMLEPDAILVDVHGGIPTAWTFEGVPAKRWDRVSYRYVPPTDASRNANGVDAAIAERMIAEGWTLYLEGLASDGTETVTFAWGLPLPVLNEACVDGVDETDGLVVREGGITEAQITLHLDHLFFDTYATDEADMRFEAVAAMADADGQVSLDDLADQPLADLVDREGEPLRTDDGMLLVYDPGPLELAEPNLREYVLAAATTTGHFNGEGHCDYVRE